MIDHVQYSPDWGGGDGYSIERITHYLDSNNESNWGTSVSPTGATPNDQNSLFIESIQATGVISMSPNPFSPNGDGYEDNLYISYHLPFTQSVLFADIYNSVGRKMITISKGNRVAMEGILMWDGKDERNIKCRVGQYLLVIEANSVYSNESWKSIERIIVAR
jgi:flagellar hook assembly protein FlgD